MTRHLRHKTRLTDVLMYAVTKEASSTKAAAHNQRDVIEIKFANRHRKTKLCFLRVFIKAKRTVQRFLRTSGKDVKDEVEIKLLSGTTIM